MAPVTDTVSLEEIRRARDVVADVARDTQVIESRYLSRTTGGAIALKAENLQRTGSFKLRGALNKIASLDPSVKGVVTGSAGNHGQSLAYAARARGLSATIFMPERATLAKVAAARESDAEIRLSGDELGECIGEARAFAEAEGLAFVHPFDDPAVIAGQGTIGLELLDEMPDLSRVLVPVGGGGLAAGVASAIKESRDGVEVIGIQSHCPLADGIAVKHPGEITGPLLERLLDDLVTVDQDAVADAIMLLLERTKLVVEGAGAVGVAALRQGAWSRRSPGKPWRSSPGATSTSVCWPTSPATARPSGAPTADLHQDRRRAGIARGTAHLPRGGGQPDRRRPRPERASGSPSARTGVELVLETRGPEHAKRLLEMIEDLGYKPDVLS